MLIVLYQTFSVVEHMEMNTILHLKAHGFVDPKNVGISVIICIAVKSRICFMFELPNLHLHVVTVRVILTKFCLVFASYR